MIIYSIICSLIGFALGVTTSFASSNLTQSILVVRVASGEKIFSQNENSYLCPASVSKLMTTATALKTWGPQKKFETKIYQNGAFNKGVLTGDLIIKGGGDPLFLSENLWQVAADLHHLGYRKITGNLLIDQSLFSHTQKSFDKKLSVHAYNATASAFAVNFNTVALAFVPGKNLGDKPLIAFDPYQLEGFRITNHVTTHPKYTKLQVSGVSHNDHELAFTAKGTIKQSETIKKVYLPATNPTQTSGALVKAFFSNRGIFIQGKVKESLLPKKAVLIYTHKSPKIKKIIRAVNTYSNNYLADVLTHNLGLAISSSGSTYENGLQAIRQIAIQTKQDQRHSVINSGSGLRASNRLSAKQVIQILRQMAQSSDVFSDFLTSLPVAGFEGTLEKRFTKKNVQQLSGRLRAKTGTLSQPISVSAIAGYFNHPQKGLLAFAILQNGVKGSKQPSLIQLQADQELMLAKIFL